MTVGEPLAMTVKAVAMMGGAFARNGEPLRHSVPPPLAGGGFKTVIARNVGDEAIYYLPSAYG